MAEDKPSAPGTPTSPFNRTVQHDAKRLAILSQAARLSDFYARDDHKIVFCKRIGP